MTNIITGPGFYRTVDGRRVELILRPGGDIAEALNLECFDGTRNGPLRVPDSKQKYLLTGAVYNMRPGEENDRIVGL
jgi:hypothetical protein